MSFKNKNVPYVIGTVLVLLVVFGVRFLIGGNVRSLEAQIQTQNLQATSLQNQIRTRQTELNQQQATVSVEAASVDAARVTKDDALATELFAKLFTWSGADDYGALRSQVMDEYHVNDGDRLVKILFPQYDVRVARANFSAESVVTSKYVGVSRWCVTSRPTSILTSRS